ncbi:hypothetical protein C1I98_24660 [Spongiactinospora gelatinilytica]|uniref:Uncharacterized protein n=1 Tax=Spongiactinospora gelatinilytica TaxID=2666298 RepID=A0A2W2FRA9_9ACTN|nr:hypothetical protein [Spongiactinospora gelatinilytica]PZG38102.1 hypothetical protein C1I98_24660 [Spongiactinospora gelatinilytica]
MTADHDIDLTALAELLVRARQARLDGISVNEAARRAAHLSGGRFSANTWRAAERGDRAVLTKASRVATMALVLSEAGTLDNITCEHLERVGAREAAEIFRRHVSADEDVTVPVSLGREPLGVEDLPKDLRAWLEGAIAELRRLPGDRRDHEEMAAALTAQTIAMYEMHVTQMRVLGKR